MHQKKKVNITEIAPSAPLTVGATIAYPNSILSIPVLGTLNVPLHPQYEPNEFITSQYLILFSVPQPISFPACSPSKVPQEWM